MNKDGLIIGIDCEFCETSQYYTLTIDMIKSMSNEDKQTVFECMLKAKYPDNDCLIDLYKFLFSEINKSDKEL